MFRRISKREAKKLFAEGKKIIYLCPCKFVPDGPFSMACGMSGREYLENAKFYHEHCSDSPIVKSSVEETAWRLMYNNWLYYNASYETGYYPHYYLED